MDTPYWTMWYQSVFSSLLAKTYKFYLFIIVTTIFPPCRGIDLTLLILFLGTLILLSLVTYNRTYETKYILTLKYVGTAYGYHQTIMNAWQKNHKAELFTDFRLIHQKRWSLMVHIPTHTLAGYRVKDVKDGSYAKGDEKSIKAPFLII